MYIRFSVEWKIKEKRGSAASTSYTRKAGMARVDLCNRRTSCCTRPTRSLPNTARSPSYRSPSGLPTRQKIQDRTQQGSRLRPSLIKRSDGADAATHGFLSFSAIQCSRAVLAVFLGGQCGVLVLLRLKLLGPLLLLSTTPIAKQTQDTSGHPEPSTSSSHPHPLRPCLVS